MTKESKRTVKTLAIASFLNDMGSDMIYPIWPLFLTTVLNANMAVLGFIDGLGEAIVSLSQAASGYISDKIRKRKIFIWLGYLFGAISRIGYALSTAWPHVVPFKILDRAGKMRGAPRDAFIAEVSTEKNRGQNFGLLRMMDNLGAVCGILASIILFGILGYRKLFFLASIPSIIAVILIISIIKERKMEAKLQKSFSFKNLDKNFRLFLLSSSVFALGAFSYSFLLIYAKEFGFKTAIVPVLYLVFTAFASLSALPFGKLADRKGRKFVMTLSYLFWCLLCISLIFFHSRITIILAFVAYGLHRGALEPVQKAFVSELSPKLYRATGIGTFQMVIGLLSLPASLLAGFLWELIGIWAPFLFASIVSAAAILLLMFVKEAKR